MARALPYALLIEDGSEDFLDAEGRVLRSQESLQLLEDMRSIRVKQGRARTRRMGGKEGKRSANGAVVVLLVMIVHRSGSLF